LATIPINACSSIHLRTPDYLFVSDSTGLSSFASRQRGNDILVKNLHFFAILPITVSYETLTKVFPLNLAYESWCQR